MKRFNIYAAAAAIALAAPCAKAQYWELANQATDMISTALSAGASYKGYVEVSYMKGFGENNGDFLGVSTSQGVMYGPHFFMGVGLGVDALFAHVDDYNHDFPIGDAPDKSVTKTGCVLPLFSDFRAIFGNTNNVQCQIGLKLGCSFLVSDSYIAVNRGYITSDECFYLQPSIGVRIPVSATNTKQAVDLSFNYRLITPSYRTYYGSADNAISLNSFGVSLGFEW